MTTFTAAIATGTIAHAAYPPTRRHYERVAPIADSFGGLDPLIDDTTFVGVHALELPGNGRPQHGPSQDRRS